MKLATLTGTRRGETDRLLASAVAQLRQEGVRMLGAVRAGAPAHPDEQCESTLLLLP